MKAIIIGSGIGGIATSIRLANKGYDVEVYEANSYPGGKLSEIRLGDYRFDAGPSLFTMPMYVDDLFRLSGKNPKEHFSYSRLDIICNYFWEDGTRLSAYADTQKLSNELQEKIGVGADVLDKALLDSKTKYELTGKIFLERPLHKLKSWLSLDVLKALTQLHKLDIFKSMHDVNQKNLQHPKLVQFFDRFATYNGSNPYQASGILNIIPHFEHHFGAYFPNDGMISITQSLVDLAKEKGVNFKMEHAVDQILISDSKAVGIRCKGEEIHSDVVVSNMDIYPSYKKLLPNEKHPDQILKSERSSSALIFYWGIKRAFPELDLHNILFSDNYKEEFQLLSNGEISNDPTIYINISSKLKNSDAPENCENWFTMINVPYNNEQDWDSLINTARKNIIDKISRILDTNISKLIEVEDILDPRKIETRTSSYAGALYGTASNDRMAAFKRHANFSSKIKNLYFCGGSVHPGGGIPLCLLSAKIIGDMIEQSNSEQV